MWPFSNKQHKYRCCSGANLDEPKSGYCGKRWGPKEKDPGPDHLDYHTKKCPECRDEEDEGSDSSSSSSGHSIGGVGVSSNYGGSSGSSGGRPSIDAGDFGN